MNSLGLCVKLRFDLMFTLHIKNAYNLMIDEIEFFVVDAVSMFIDTS